MNSVLDKLLDEEIRKEARNSALDEAAAICELMCPQGGRAWTPEQSACFEALSTAAENIRKLKTV